MVRISTQAWCVVLLTAVCVAPVMARREVPLVINEVMASNDATIADPQDEYDDWIEIHNCGDTAFDLGGMCLTDDLDAPTKWRIPADDPALTTVAPGGYLLIWADGDTADLGLHASFKLDADGEDVGLFDTDGATLIDGVTYPALTCDVPYGRCPDAHDEWRHLSVPTPGAANEGAYEGAIAELEFSHEHGFYDELLSVTITIETPDVTIYYTLDGDAPGRVLARGISGKVYHGPLTIERTTCLRAIARRENWKPSTVRTQTYIFLDDVVEQSLSGQNPSLDWPSPGGGGGGFGGGQTMDYGMDPDVIYDVRYADLMDDALLSVPSISLVTDLKHLFDSSTGIYVNALQDGRQWERPASLELIYPDGSEGFQVNAGLRIRGGYGRLGSNPKHAFRLFFRSEYGASRLRYPLFGDEGVDEFEKVDLRTAQNYSWSYKGAGGLDHGGKNTMLREVFSRDVQGAMGQPYTRSRYYHLYLNGQYWGLYQTQERSEARYAASYLGGDPEDYDVVKVDAGPGRPYTMEATDGTLDAYHRLWQAARDGFSSNEAYCRVQGLNPDGSRSPDYERLLDVDNVIDYMLCTFYVGDFDAPVSNFFGNSIPNNFYGLYNRANPDGFKFFRHDSEHTLFELYENRTGPYPAGQQAELFNPQWLHQRLVAHGEYRMRFADRAYEHFFNDGAMTPAAAADFLWSRKSTIDLAIIAESARWGDAKVSRPRTKDDDWLPQVDYLINDYFPFRTDVVLNQLRSKNWYPSVDAPTFNQHGGVVDSGFSLVMTAPAGDIYYALEGRDPRLRGGAVNTPHATRYTGPVTLEETTRVRARVLDTGTWSAVHDVVFSVRP
ncbi:MAG: chitobiase/beta-hexosaminidase C-terminal domain-containing protein [Phycisphaerales bacterium]|nr:MAG: chitobiase/beta-hexosaminidase C-terminal domain-containing protein [Phycisphaerales bacterium]